MVRLIKKYSNRRMYDTKTSQPVTLSELADLIKQGEEIQVMDHQTGKNLTSLTLTQILLGQEKGGKELFPVILRELIKKRGNSVLRIQENRKVLEREIEDILREKVREVENLYRRQILELRKNLENLRKILQKGGYNVRQRKKRREKRD